MFNLLNTIYFKEFRLIQTTQFLELFAVNKIHVHLQLSPTKTQRQQTPASKSFLCTTKATFMIVLPQKETAMACIHRKRPH